VAARATTSALDPIKHESWHTGLVEKISTRDGRQRVLQALRRAGRPLGVQDVAALVGLHENSVRFHLDRLVDEGAATREAEPRTGRGRPRHTYAVTAEPGAHGDHRDYRLLSEILAGAMSTGPDPTSSAISAGRRWGRYLAPEPRPFQQTDKDAAMAEVVRIMSDIGFAPELVGGNSDESGQRVALHHCPFLEVATEHPEIVCSVHLGLIQGALETLRSPLAATDLAPWATPSTCVATINAT
jgi:predicted ArsR family transcriptional regulator